MAETALTVGKSATAAKSVTVALLSRQEIIEPLCLYGCTYSMIGCMKYATRVKQKYKRQELSKNID